MRTRKWFVYIVAVGSFVVGMQLANAGGKAYTFKRFIVPANGSLARNGECRAEDMVMVPANGTYAEPGPLAIRCVHPDSLP